MSHSTADLWEQGQLPGLGPIKQIGAGLKLARQHWLGMLVIWVVLSVLAYGMGQAMVSMGLLTVSATSPHFLGVMGASAVITATVTAITYRTLLGRPPFSFDGGVLAYIGLMTVLTLVPTVGMRLVTGAPPTDPGDTQAMMAYSMRGLGVGLVYLIGALVFIKLMLWPIGLAVGDRDVTPGVSWKLTHRAFWGFILGAILLALVPLIISTVLNAGAAGGAARTPGMMPKISPLSAPFTGLFSLATAIVAAGLYSLRRGADAETAATFD